MYSSRNSGRIGCCQGGRGVVGERGWATGKMGSRLPRKSTSSPPRSSTSTSSSTSRNSSKHNANADNGAGNSAPTVPANLDRRLPVNSRNSSPAISEKRLLATGGEREKKYLLKTPVAAAAAGVAPFGPRVLADLPPPVDSRRSSFLQKRFERRLNKPERLVRGPATPKRKPAPPPSPAKSNTAGFRRIEGSTRRGVKTVVIGSGGAGGEGRSKEKISRSEEGEDSVLIAKRGRGRKGKKGEKARIEVRVGPPLNKIPLGKLFGADKVKSWELQQAVQSARTPTEVR